LRQREVVPSAGRQCSFHFVEAGVELSDGMFYVIEFGVWIQVDRMYNKGMYTIVVLA
jgi:hypothetical protein